VRALSDALQETIQFLTTVKTLPFSPAPVIYLISLSMVCIAYWSFLLLTLVQTGLGLRALRSCSHRVRKWSITLAIWGLILIVLFFVGVLFAGAVFGLTFFGGLDFPVHGLL
jgi:Na+/proline symporter